MATSSLKTARAGRAPRATAARVLARSATASNAGAPDHRALSLRSFYLPRAPIEYARIARGEFGAEEARGSTRRQGASRIAAHARRLLAPHAGGDRRGRARRESDHGEDGVRLAVVFIDYLKSSVRAIATRPGHYEVGEISAG